MSLSGLREFEQRETLPGIADALETAFAQMPSPDQNENRALSLLGAAAGFDTAGLQRAWQNEPEQLVQILRALCSVAPFLAAFVGRHPEWLLRLVADDLVRQRSGEEFDQRLQQALNEMGADDAGDALRRFKYYELARITVRDCTPELVPEARVAETLAELSHLAEALLRSAQSCAAERLERELGPPHWKTSAGETLELHFVVLALGKLGGEELNYSSDVDLVYVHSSPPEGEVLQDGPSGLAPEEYFARLAHALRTLVAEQTSEGFLYRIDLELRPEGSQGPLVVSGNTLINYYEAWAASWEKTAFMKARPVAGDLQFGWQLIRSVDPIIYHSFVDLMGIAAIREMKQRIETEKLRKGSQFDVKLGAGGIRDVEFIAQSLQLLHGGRAPQVRGRSAQDALIALADARLLDARQAEALLAAYRFLRRVENRLQMEAERQTHRMPTSAAALERLAASLGYHGPDELARFNETLEQHRRNVRQVFDSMYAERSSDQLLELFVSNARRLMQLPSARNMFERLAQHFDREIDASPDPERALIGLERFIQGVGGRSFFYELLLDRPELVPRLVALFGTSRYLSNFFATHPELIESVFRDPDVLLHNREQLDANLRDIEQHVSEDRDDVEASLAALRLFHHREFVNVGLLDLSGKVTQAEVESALSDVAELCIEHGLGFAREQLVAQRKKLPEVEDSEFLVVAMGKLGSRELSYGSDLDLIFLYDAPHADDATLPDLQEYFVRQAQKLVSLIQTPTAEGICFEVDSRLRPSGQQGMLVTSIASFENYHQRSGQTWERQALLRSRPVAGADALAARFQTVRKKILSEPPPEDLRTQVRRIRQRMEDELARESAGRYDFKTGRGGLVDIENIVQCLQLEHGREHPELLDSRPFRDHLERLLELGLLSPEHGAVLGSGWEFLQRLAGRLRVVENRAISDLDAERGDLDVVARACGYSPSSRTGSARLGLLEDYRRHTEAIRRVYLEMLGD